MCALNLNFIGLSCVLVLQDFAESANVKRALVLLKTTFVHAANVQATSWAVNVVCMCAIF